MIIGTTRAVRVFAFPAPVDLRKGYDGLFGLVQTGLARDPLSGELFLFVNQSRKLCKVLLWDGTGLCIFQKRLEKGTFAKLWRDDGQVVHQDSHTGTRWSVADDRAVDASGLQYASRDRTNGLRRTHQHAVAGAEQPFYGFGAAGVLVHASPG